MIGKTRRPLGGVAAAAVLAILALPAPAAANGSMLSFVMDDDLLVYKSTAARDYALDTMKRSGVDGVRVTVSWKFVSGEESGLPRVKPRRFAGAGAENPRSYRADIWDRFDHLLRAAHGRGMLVLLNLTGPGPVWAHPRAPFRHRFDQPAWKPNLGEWHRFVKAVGTRYSGAYRDENDGHRLLPRAYFWSVWNEPNQPASLAPQLEYEPRLRRVIPVAPRLYRELYYSATSALSKTGHARDTILMGETAPLGAVRNTPRVHLWPKQFLREMFCLRPNGVPYRGLEAAVRRCDQLRRYGRFRVSAYAHHPYKQRVSPLVRDRFRDSITFANLHELPPFLDFLAARTGLIPRGLPVALTEHGWETMPPDPVTGVSPDRQAEYLNLASRIAYLNPRVTMETQFIFRDVAPRLQYRGDPRRLNLYWATWQSGLLFADGSPKPAFYAYLMPIVAGAGAVLPDGRRQVDLWGQVRFLTPGQPRDLYLQYRPAGSTDWHYAAGPISVTHPQGFWETSVPAPGPGSWRAAMGYENIVLTSRAASVAF